ncbi:fumarylacetoacetate hydrolase family protein [Pseudoteredinibacter isoporae]|uniref:2-keto-4-pentenoate hydratase/2-oxohepta-3-ene-1,7-dioic acid hydratase in catechol pathway n=1 Tax=Pseudoteredinibacter isoporae TaxID=570281 RepID=A0A7X0MWU7_9GAMM|nr:fumarylacetoacetate hydrolase family protein [Pseudoteredinibacter isoporae]MBB6522585.1 2-keto-4-pentenoate hydratase/2-oxohepta-3-ene-1,7-dioic acid hydratase in catechol pathway [Pseudoteredinibacter isoporae]NHO88115.1 fumarylacetoacetate hydrolase family protein [Pseudoteredinibacter isoporae]NIB23554.1 fumarylacetoacetate hydrolase family protein [Pseudoteredinibacter isoporae]
MKLLRVGPKGQEKPALLDEQGIIRDLSTVVDDINADAISPENLEKLRQLNLSEFPQLDKSLRIGACVANVGKFVCVGLNYADHAAETGAEIPSEPEVFNKWTSAICGPNDNIIKPKNSSKLDWEVELGIVIGKSGRYIDESEAETHIAGYCVVNDVSERNFQLERGCQWDKGKGCDTFGPIGPWLVTRDEIDNVLNLSMYLEVNGKRYQDGNSETMIFSPNYIVSYLSQFMSLEAGDIITTGTPPGVGLGQTPPVYLNAGDQIELSIQGLGRQQQTVVEYSEAEA